jgi:hypothetical protein
VGKTLIITDVSHRDVIHYDLYEVLSNRSTDPEFIFFISPGNLNGFDPEIMAGVTNKTPTVYNQPERVRFGRAAMLTMMVEQMVSDPLAENATWLLIGRAPWLAAVKEMLFELHGVKAAWLPVLSVAGMDGVFGDPRQYIEKIRLLNARAQEQRKGNLTVAELSNVLAKHMPESMNISWRKKYFGARRMEAVFRASGLIIKGKLVKGQSNKQPVSSESSGER